MCREGDVLRLYSETPDDALFAENETNTVRHPGMPGTARFAKDAFDRHLVQGLADAVNPARIGTKVAPLFRRTVGAGRRPRSACALPARRRSRIRSARNSTRRSRCAGARPTSSIAA
jgi:hypothetical protein